MNYQDYLKSDHWQEKRKEALAHWGNKCSLCGKEYSLQVHHLSYSTLWSENPETDLIVFCDRCHEGMHIIADITEIDAESKGDCIEQVFMALTWSWQR